MHSYTDDPPFRLGNPRATGIAGALGSGTVLAVFASALPERSAWKQPLLALSPAIGYGLGWLVQRLHRALAERQLPAATAKRRVNAERFLDQCEARLHRLLDDVAPQNRASVRADLGTLQTARAKGITRAAIIMVLAETAAEGEPAAVPAPESRPLPGTEPRPALPFGAAGREPDGLGPMEPRSLDSSPRIAGHLP